MFLKISVNCVFNTKRIFLIETTWQLFKYRYLNAFMFKTRRTNKFNFIKEKSYIKMYWNRDDSNLKEKNWLENYN